MLCRGNVDKILRPCGSWGLGLELRAAVIAAATVADGTNSSRK
jgi:hypothetical protein